MKRLAMALLAGSLALGTVPGFAHDEGHGPKITDAGKQGGVLSSVVDMKDSKKGGKAAMIYKAELVRSEDGTVRVYLYDQAMNPLDMSKLSPEAKAVVGTKKKGKYTKVPFVLKQEEGVFTGVAPKPAVRPFDIDVTIKEGERELLVAFDNLD